ncbi:PREDICTED: GDSL esterase/lipase At5g03980-like [Nicotiana attenuata]|uniref:Gdsl esteraselipase n=1 Tax=Nicotiana attenuata TaxID=49451 RepID=A0A314L7K2_NICAT|nr:PREDICTED: GDSL esterase/lipase At5g03980-like [Nicotiana attenuata]OIT37761.1 gdsl esteraselipase [Nicotiana attenuata]
MALLIQVLMSFLVVQQCFEKSDAQLMLQIPALSKCGLDKIYQLGDSLSDTGNFIRLSIWGSVSPFAKLPYGENFFKKGTGRASDGMLIIDFIALESGLPLLNPYMDQNANFAHGANFAVIGATALQAGVLAEKKIYNPLGNGSLDMQLGWMSSHFQYTCHYDCSEYLKSSLFLVGEIGGNEFFYGLTQGKTMEDLRNMVPEVVQNIVEAVNTVIGFGAIRIFIPGNFPIGCLPMTLTTFLTNNSMAYDENHCLKDLNNLAISYNEHLQQAIEDLKKKNPNVTLIYGDYYNAYQWLLQHTVNHGFDQNSLRKACCGEGGYYNYDAKRQCGFPGVPVCADPSTYISWDGVNLTEKAYSLIARWLIDDILPQLKC